MTNQPNDHQPATPANLKPVWPWTPNAGAAQPQPPKKRRVFMWVFLAVQVLFVVWIIAGASTAGGQPTDCGTLDADTCNAASDAGTALGVGLVIVFWFFVDLFLGVGYAVYRLAKRP